MVGYHLREVVVMKDNHAGETAIASAILVSGGRVVSVRVRVGSFPRRITGRTLWLRESRFGHL